MFKSTISLLLCLALTAGCHVDTSPKTVMSFGNGNWPGMMRTQYNGVYELYRIPDRPTDELERAGRPIASLHLERGRLLGFKLGPERRPVAVAGLEIFPLEDGLYQWVMKADPGQFDAGKSLLLAGIIVVGTVAIVGLLILIVQADRSRSGYGYY